MNDDVCVGKAIEGNLREEMVFSLILHASHEQQPKEVFLFVISTGAYLVVHEGHVRILSEPLLVLVISHQNNG